MASAGASFSVKALGSRAADRADLDAALSVYIKNTSPLLRTLAQQIRQKVHRPNNPEGRFYFVAFYRGDVVIGFSMFGYYPRTRLLAIDHLVIDAPQRGEAAFFIFAHLIRDLTDNLGLEVDFAIVEVERHNEFGGEQTGGEMLVRLLSQVGFGEVHMDYVLPNMEPRNYTSRYRGTLMLRGPEKLYSIRRENLVDLYRSIIYEHYFPWFRDFFGSDTPGYKAYLDQVFQEFQDSLREAPIVKINGEAPDRLVPQPVQPNPHPFEFRLLAQVALFAASSAVLVAAALLLKVPPALVVPLFLGLLVVFAGIAAIGNGHAMEIFQQTLLKLPFGRRKLSYRQSGQSPVRAVRGGQRPRMPRSNSVASSADTPR